MILAHVTHKRNLNTIEKTGICGPSYWTINPRILQYYADDITENKSEFAIVTTTLKHFRDSDLQPDHPSISEPITTALKQSEWQIWTNWQHAKRGDWRDSLRIVSSLQIIKTVKPESLRITTNLSQILIQLTRNALAVQRHIECIEQFYA